MAERKFHIGVKALITDGGRILILKTNSIGMHHDHPDHWDLPGGRIEENDSVEKTLHKELKEELGVENVNVLGDFDTGISNLSYKVDGDDVGLMLMVYRCSLADNTSFKLSSEHLEYKWASIDEAKELLKIKFSNSFIEKLDEL